MAHSRVGVWIIGLFAVLLFAARCTLGTTKYVDAACTNAAHPYSTWETAASNIQDAVDAAANGDVVLVTNGVYSLGGHAMPGFDLYNRVLVTNAVTVESINGPETTVIEGEGPLGPAALRCAFLTNGAQMIGFTLSNGYTTEGVGFSYPDRSGGGAIIFTNSLLSNCVVCANVADFYGGGIRCGIGARIVCCTIARNQSALDAGGIYCDEGGDISWSTIAENSALGAYGEGGGVVCSIGGRLLNCTIARNFAKKIWRWCVLLL